MLVKCVELIPDNVSLYFADPKRCCGSIINHLDHKISHGTMLGYKRSALLAHRGLHGRKIVLWYDYYVWLLIKSVVNLHYVVELE